MIKLLNLFSSIGHHIFVKSDSQLFTFLCRLLLFLCLAKQAILDGEVFLIGLNDVTICFPSVWII